MEQGVSWEASEGSAPPALPRASTEQPSQRKPDVEPRGTGAQRDLEGGSYCCCSRSEK